MVRLVGSVSIALACLAVGCDSDSAATTTTHLIASSESTAPDSSRSEIAALLDRIEGHQVSYRVELVSPAFVGVWHVVERDGEIIEAEYLGDAEPHEDRPWLSLAEALRIAGDADAAVADLNQSATSIRLTVDADVNAIDDEFKFYATGITVES